jgi:hypothetical protein
MTRKRRDATIAKAISTVGGQAPISLPSTAPVAPATPQVSLPTPGAPPPPGLFPPQAGGMDPVSNVIMWLNTNPYLIGILMLLLNLGGRFLALELTKKQEAFLQAAWVRPAIFFTVIFIATRNLVVAFWITLLFFFIIWVAANENSPFCMIPSWCGHDVKTPAEMYEANVAALR